MKKHKIAAALVCVVFLMGLWGAVAGGQERPDSRRDSYWTNTPGGWESWMGGEPPPGSSYLPEGLTPWDNIPYLCAHDPYPAYGNLGTEPLNSGVGVPEPSTVVLLLSGGLGVLAWAWRRRRRR